MKISYQCEINEEFGQCAAELLKVFDYLINDFFNNEIQHSSVTTPYEVADNW